MVSRVLSTTPEHRQFEHPVPVEAVPALYRQIPRAENCTSLRLPAGQHTVMICYEALGLGQ